MKKVVSNPIAYSPKVELEPTDPDSFASVIPSEPTVEGWEEKTHGQPTGAPSLNQYGLQGSPGKMCVFVFVLGWGKVEFSKSTVKGQQPKGQQSTMSF